LKKDTGKWCEFHKIPWHNTTSATIAATTMQPEKLEEPEDGEHLFYSWMWVKGTPLHFIVDRESQKNLISTEVVKRMKFPTIPHLQPYTIEWLSGGGDIYISQQRLLLYDIKPFKDEVLCNVLLGQPYMWKRHIVYESLPRSVT
jgi:hypothetical protein